MTRANEPWFSELNPSIRRKVEDFQDYIVTRYYGNDDRGHSAKPLIQAIGDAISRQYGEEGKPLDLESVVRALRASLKYESVRVLRFSGRTFPVKGGFEISIYRTPGSDQMLFPLDELPMTSRERFTIAHELGHLFFFRGFSLDGFPERIIPRGSVSNAAKRNEYSREEGLCDQFAGALVFPRDLGFAVPDVPSLEGALALAKDLQINYEPVLRRILYDFDLWQNAVFYRITLTKRPTVKTFRGKRRRAADPCPGKRELEEVIGNCRSTRDVCERLCDRYRLSERNVRHLGPTLWLMHLLDSSAG